jgi:hypothetical protein
MDRLGSTGSPALTYATVISVGVLEEVRWKNLSDEKSKGGGTVYPAGRGIGNIME